ncbi:MAG: hypothetical protein ABIN01_22560 [Ferruginibacter sp.]
MIHKQFEYGRKLSWATLFLIVFFSTASSMIKKKPANKNIDTENVSLEALPGKLSILPLTYSQVSE